MSRFVEGNGLGVVLDREEERDFGKVIQELRTFQGRFRVSDDLRERCPWEAIEHRLLEAQGWNGRTGKA